MPFSTYDTTSDTTYDTTSDITSDTIVSLKNKINIFQPF